MTNDLDGIEMTQASVTDARNFANYSYLALLILGALMALAGLWNIISFISILGYWGFAFFGGLIFWGIVLLALGGFGVFTAFTVWKPKIVDAIDQGRYMEAYQVASNPVQLIIGIVCGGVIPGILLFLTQQKLAEIARPPPPPPPS
ncbi:MAG: hypothetical protein QW797_06025 [Thermoproteota archaeon]